MSLTNRILIAMAAGILLGSLISLVSYSAAAPEFLRTFLNEYLVGGLFDVVGRIFVASQAVGGATGVCFTHLWFQFPGH